MNLSESLKIAVKCIRANWMRSLLTMLGIIIGISSVIMIIGAGTGARDYIVSLIEDMGSNAVLVSVDTTQAANSDYITLDDVANIKDKVAGVERCSPMMMAFASGTLDATTQEVSVMVIGVNSDVQFAMTTNCTYGRFFTDDEYNAAAPMAVMGTNSAITAYGYEDVTGQTVTVNSSGGTMKMKVCGVADIDSIVSSFGGGMSSMFQSSSKTTIALFMPCTTLCRLTGSEPVLQNVFVIGEEGANNEAIGNATVNYLKVAHGNYSSSVYSADDMATYVNIVNIVMSVLTAFIAGVGAISLLVGGIGVMNIMLVSVTERTREIGIRKSLGAKTGTITMQFLTESIIICLIGGLIGVVAGVSGAYLVTGLIGMGIRPNINILTVLIALVFSSSVGLFFGIYPARKAAKLSPIDALRRE